VMVLCFLSFPLAERFRNRIRWWDAVAAVASVAILVYAIWGGEEFTDRATSPTRLDVILGVIFIVLLLEATRRTSGWIMPLVGILFIVYAMTGPYLPPPWTHRGYDVSRLIGHLFITLEGIFGVAVDVSSSLIILFTIYGAFLQHSGAGKFFIDFSLALMGGKPNSAGRTVVLSSFLLGGPSGSGVATTVTIGAVAYPMMQRAGFEKNAAGGLLAAGGLGAILSPPVLGAAAFLIAEFLKISYLDVIWMATIPTCLYYLSLLFMVELDAKRFGAEVVPYDTSLTLWQMTRRYGFHFTSLIAVIVFMVVGYSPMLAVFYSTLMCFVLSFLRPETALKGKKLVRALADGSIGVLNAATTCASAGIIVGVVTLTGLGLKFSSIVLEYAGGSLLLTAIYTALVVWIVGLAVPVTASYIICAVITAPALTKLGVPDFAAHMFIFYYAVLSEVSPPTALSPFAAAAITGGDPYRTTMQAWKYTLPAFLVPFVFVLDPQGVGLLMKIPRDGSVWDIFLVTAKTAAGLACLAAAAQNWALRQNTFAERLLWTVAGLLLVFPSLLEAVAETISGYDVPHPAPFGLAIAAALLIRQLHSPSAAAAAKKAAAKTNGGG
jgi:TRAP transporter 4TM/12TM fusion protein